MKIIGGTTIMKKKLKTLIPTGGGGVTLVILLSLCILAGCPTEGDGGPSGVEIGGDLYNLLPEPETFITAQKNIPNIFKSYRSSSANVNAGNWDLRREEMLQIAQHYLLGYMPSTEGISTTFNVVGDNLVYTISNGTASHTFNVAYYPPSGTPPADGWPAVLFFAAPTGTTRSIYLDAGIAVLGVPAGQFDSGDNENGVMYGVNNSEPPGNRGGAVHALFGYATEGQYGWSSRLGHDGDRTNTNPANFRDLASRGNPDAPGVLINWAWGFSRVVDALEAEAAKPLAERRIRINPTQLGVTGTSRNGKGALLVGAFDSRIAVTNPVSSGSGGVLLERWVATAATEQQILSNGEITPTLNMAYYYVKSGLSEVRGTTWMYTVLPQEALKDPAGDPSGGPFAEKTAYHVAANPNPERPAGWTAGPNINAGYEVVNFGSLPTPDAIDGMHQGTQTLVDCRWAYPAWFNTRFWGWPNLHPETNIAYRPNRGDNAGYLDNMPFDMHFITSAVAPRGLLYHDGIHSNNTNPEAEYQSYLVTREAYRMLGKEQNIGIRIYNIGHGNPAREHQELAHFLKTYIAGNDPGEFYRQNYFPLNDPRTKWNYAYMDWAAPGYESLKTQVEKGYPWVDNKAPQDLPQP
jgi:hypothetical protein